jgi:hypothetical protein
MGENSVEQLEQRVAELEATVRGLTDELVDTTERLRQLEDGGQEVSDSPVTNESTESTGSGSQSGPTELDPTSSHPVENSADDDGAPVNDDGSVEATADGEAEETESSESGETDESDDIIVA